MLLVKDALDFFPTKLTLMNFLRESNCPILIQAKEHMIQAVVLRVWRGLQPAACHLALFGVPTQGSERAEEAKGEKEEEGGWLAGWPAVGNYSIRVKSSCQEGLFSCW